MMRRGNQDEGEGKDLLNGGKKQNRKVFGQRRGGKTEKEKEDYICETDKLLQVVWVAGHRRLYMLPLRT